MIEIATNLLLVGEFARLLVLLGMTAALALMLWVWHLMNLVAPPTSVA